MKLKICILIAKIIHLTSKLLNIGSGYTYPGYIALKIYPSLLSDKTIKYKKGIVFITGTNGKSTTSKIITHLLQKQNLKVNHNTSGANILNGIAGAVLLDLSFLGNPKSDIAVFEIDEFALSKVLKFLTPNVICLLNLSRDQLDRYHELDIIINRWIQSFSEISNKVSFVVDSLEPQFKPLKPFIKHSQYGFDDNDGFLKLTSLKGSFNAKNVNAAVLVLKALNLFNNFTESHLKDFVPAYGRGEIVNYKKGLFSIYLAKNPASLNNNLALVISDFSKVSTLLFVLNDNIPDGKDISWIYDIDPTLIKKACANKKVFVSGTRALDMAVRLRYAGAEINQSNVITNIKHALTQVLQGLGKDTNVLVLPNYSSMLEVRQVLTGKKIL